MSKIVYAVLVAVVASVVYVFIQGTFDEESVRGKNVIITGASTGIGEQLAYHYARMGANVLVTARREERLQEVVAKCKKLAPEGTIQTYIVYDMNKLSSMDQFISNAVKSLGGTLDYLVLNHIAPNALEWWEGTEMNFKTLDMMVDVNFKAYVRLATYAFPFLEEKSGHLVVVSSVAGKIAVPFSVPYSSTKFALFGFFDGLRLEGKIKKSNVSITTCIIGFIGTENAMNNVQTFVGKSVMEAMQPASPSETAYAIIKGAGLRYREVFYPYFTSKLTVLSRDFFIEIVEIVIRSVYNK